MEALEFVGYHSFQAYLNSEIQLGYFYLDNGVEKYEVFSSHSAAERLIANPLPDQQIRNVPVVKL